MILKFGYFEITNFEAGGHGVERICWECAVGREEVYVNREADAANEKVYSNLSSNVKDLQHDKYSKTP